MKKLILTAVAVFCFGLIYGQLTNVAVNKPSKQSSILGNTDGYSARYANDGIPQTLGGGTIMCTNSENQPWWEVDLEDSYTISSIKLYNRTNCCPERLDGFTILVSDKPFTGNSGGTAFITNEAAPDGTKSYSGNATGRYVRIFLNGNNYLSIPEIEIFGKVAQSKTFTQEFKNITPYKLLLKKDGKVIREVGGNVPSVKLEVKEGDIIIVDVDNDEKIKFVGNLGMDPIYMTKNRGKAAIILEPKEAFKAVNINETKKDILEMPQNLCGMDIAEYDPLYVGGSFKTDLIFKSIGDYTYDYEITTDGKNYIHKGFNYTGGDYLLERSNEMNSYYSKRSFQESINVGISVEVPIKAVTVGTGFAYGKQNKQTTETDDVYYSSELYYEGYSVFLKDYKLSDVFLTDNFINAVKNLNDSSEVKSKIIDIYGTHYPTKVVYGGYARSWKQVSKSTFEEMERQNIDVHATVKVAQPTSEITQKYQNSNGGATWDEEQKWQDGGASGNVAFNFSHVKQNNYKEQLTNSAGNYKSVGGAGNEVAIRTDLRLITHLIYPHVFKDGTVESELAEKRQWIEDAIAEHMKLNVPKLSSGLPKVRLYKARIEYAKRIDELDDANKQMKGSIRLKTTNNLNGVTDEVQFWSSVNFADIHEGKKELQLDTTYKIIQVPQIDGKYSMTVEPVINLVNKDDLVPHDRHQLDKSFQIVLDGKNTLTNPTATVKYKGSDGHSTWEVKFTFVEIKAEAEFNNEANYEGNGNAKPFTEIIRQVSTAPENIAWGISTSNTNSVWKSSDGGNNWVSVPGIELKQVSAVNYNTAWGIKADNTIWKTKDGKTWQQVPGGLSQVSAVDYNTAWGIGVNRDIFKTQNGKDWIRVPGGLSQVSAIDYNTAWGVNSAGNIYRIKAGGQWQQVPGGLSQVSAVDYNIAWGIGVNRDIFKTQNGKDWIRVPGELDNISAIDYSYALGVQSNQFTPITAKDKPTVITFANHSGYLAKYTLRYTFNGQQVIKETGEVRNPNEMAYEIPGGALNVYVKAEGLTGLVWAPLTVNFEQTYTVPVSRTIESHGTTLNQSYKEFDENYQLLSKGNAPPPPSNERRIIVRNKGAYNAKYTIRYTLNGQPKTINSGNVMAGQEKKYDVSADAVNLSIQAEGSTGLVWEPWVTHFKQTYPKAAARIIESYGTTLNQSYKELNENGGVLSQGNTPPPPADTKRITFKNRAAYTARYILEYNLQGRRVTENSGNLTAGRDKSFDIPRVATNVKIKAEGATGLAWEKWRKHFDKTYPNAVTKTIESKGTTLNQSAKEY